MNKLWAAYKLPCSSVSPNHRKRQEWPSAGAYRFDAIGACFGQTDSIGQRTSMSSVHPSTSVCIFGPVYSAQTLNTDNDFIGDMQLFVAISSVMPLGVGHVALGCSPSRPGTSTSSRGGNSSTDSTASLSSPSTDATERFLLLKTAISR